MKLKPRILYFVLIFVSLHTIYLLAERYQEITPDDRLFVEFCSAISIVLAVWGIIKPIRLNLILSIIFSILQIISWYIVFIGYIS